MRNFTMSSTKLDDTVQTKLDSIGNIISNTYLNVYLVGSLERQNEYIKKFGQFSNRKFIITNDYNVRNENSNIIVCVEKDRKNYLDIYEYFKQKGWKENVNFFQEEIYEAFYHVYVRNRVVVDRIEIVMTTYCTLNCQKCISYIPYQKKQHFSIEQLLSDADLLFRKVDYVKKMKLLGGEGFIYPHLKEYVTYLYDNYRDQIGEIRIGTNGTIYPSEDILKLCREKDIIVDISDYTCAVPDKCELDNIVALFRDNNIRYDIKRSGEKWLDMGFPDNIPKERTDSELEMLYHKCAIFCRNFYQGKLYHCCSNCAAVISGLFPDNENDCLNFHKDIKKKDILAFELGYTPLGYLTFCKVCQGGSEDANQNLIDVAVQCS